MDDLDPSRSPRGVERRPRRRLTLARVVIVVLVAVLLGELGVFVAGRVPACALTPADECTRVLFIGNSYTFANDLPGTFARLAASGGHRVETGMIAPGGGFLSDQAANPATATTISGTRWTAVVLQEQSQRPASPTEATAMFLPAVSRLAAMAMADGARPLLLETWAHRDGWPEMHQDYAAMQAAIDRAYAAASAQTGATLAPAGEAWQRVLARDPSIALWQEDGSHPAPAGTYLAACALYQALFATSPVGLSDHESLPGSLAAELQQIAAGR